MWVIAGLLLGAGALASLIGFHAGPHSHAVGAGFGGIAAIWLLVMAASGHADPLLWTIFGADLVLSVGIGTAAYKAFTTPPPGPAIARIVRGLDGAEAVAVTNLEPDGIVRVRGEEWSATSLNGPVTAGSAVQVISSKGVRLEVWGESLDDLSHLHTSHDHPEPLAT